MTDTDSAVRYIDMSGSDTDTAVALIDAAMILNGIDPDSVRHMVTQVLKSDDENSPRTEDEEAWYIQGVIDALVNVHVLELV